MISKLLLVSVWNKALLYSEQRSDSSEKGKVNTEKKEYEHLIRQSKHVGWMHKHHARGQTRKRKTRQEK